MLPSRPKIIHDESAESFLIRLSHANGYSVRQLIDIYYNERFRDIAHSVPDLSSINLNHASISSSRRFYFFKKIAAISNNSQESILGCLVYRSGSIYSQSSTVLLSRSIEIPANLYLSDHIPVCPQCLEENNYIRHIWHFKPYMFCHKHKAALIDSCPYCNRKISYVKDELISKCPCGCIYSKVKPLKTNTDCFLSELSSLVENSFNNKEAVELPEVNLLPTNNINSLFGMIVFYFVFYEKDFGKVPIPNISQKCNKLRSNRSILTFP